MRHVTVSGVWQWIVGRLERSWHVRRSFRRLMFGLRRSAVSPPVGLSYMPSLYGEQPIRPAAKSALFVTARFRTGSTLLWQLFNCLDDVTAYYEPLNERRWFEEDVPYKIDPTHRGVTDYAAQYRGLDALAAYHSPYWSNYSLWMDAGSQNDEMQNYINILIDSSKNIAVLQFNRVDFRLRWLRSRFPGARIVHLVRNPRKQWLSTFYGDAIDPRLPIRSFKEHDYFYMLNWLDDLKCVFPCLDLAEWQPAYKAFYLLWRLSEIEGRAKSDVTITYENLVADPTTTVTTALGPLRGDLCDEEKAAICRAVKRPRRDAALPAEVPKAWFDEVEASCEAVLQAALGAPP